MHLLVPCEEVEARWEGGQLEPWTQCHGPRATAHQTPKPGSEGNVVAGAAGVRFCGSVEGDRVSSPRAQTQHFTPHHNIEYRPITSVAGYTPPYRTSRRA